jgi:hypothetical protein
MLKYFKQRSNCIIFAFYKNSFDGVEKVNHLVWGLEARSSRQDLVKT